ncbi:hypothetical protein HDU81_011252 [Chytriomyces hyalinus]|nr:hypothetical protein HDU81_011252 [Chytriomyces hyalinus]
MPSASHISTANANEYLHCDGYGDVVIPLPNHTHSIKISDAKYSPQVTTHLLSDNDLEAAGYHLVHMSGAPAKLYQTATSSHPCSSTTPLLHVFIMDTIKHQGLHILPTATSTTPTAAMSSYLASSVKELRVSDMTHSQIDTAVMQVKQDLLDYDRRHCAFGHASIDRLKFMQAHQTTEDLKLVAFPPPIRHSPCETCTACIKNKAPFPPTQVVDPPLPGHTISFDVLEVSPPHLHKYPFYLVSADWESGYTMGFLLQHKHESLVE